MAEQITLLLEQLPVPVQIEAVETFDTAISVSERLVPDLAIVDLQLTLGSGFSVLRVLAKANPRPRIIVLTNYGLPNYREYALLSGADYFLDKALEFEALHGIVEMIAQQKALSNRSKDVELNDRVDDSLSHTAATKT